MNLQNTEVFYFNNRVLKQINYDNEMEKKR